MDNLVTNLRQLDFASFKEMAQGNDIGSLSMKAFCLAKNVGLVGLDGLNSQYKNVVSVVANIFESGKSIWDASTWTDIGYYAAIWTGVAVHVKVVEIWVRTSFTKNVTNNVGIINKNLGCIKFTASSLCAISTLAPWTLLIPFVRQQAEKWIGMSSDQLMNKGIQAANQGAQLAVNYYNTSSGTELAATAITVLSCGAATVGTYKWIASSYNKNITKPKLALAQAAQRRNQQDNVQQQGNVHQQGNIDRQRPLPYKAGFLGKAGRITRFAISTIAAVSVSAAFIGYNIAAKGLI